MYKIWAVVQTEYVTSVRSKAFLVGLILLPVFMLGGLAVQYFAKDKVDIRPRRFAVVDSQGSMFGALEQAARSRNEIQIYTPKSNGQRKQIRPAFEPELFDGGSAPIEKLELELSEKVRAKKLFAFLTIQPHLGTNTTELDVTYYTDSQTFHELPAWIDEAINKEIQRQRMRRAGVNEQVFQDITRRLPMRQKGLAELSASGELLAARDTNRAAAFGIPVGAMFLLFMLVMSSVPALMSSVLEEKGQKIAEVLIASISPFQLMLGKLLAGTFVSLTLAVLYLGAIVVVAWKNEFLGLIPLSMFFWFFLFHALALLTFGALSLAIGAACTDIRDAQNLSAPLTLLLLIPAFVWFPVFQSPNGAFARVISLFPPATPMLMLLRIGVKPGPPVWEILLGVGLSTLFMLLCVWAAGKTFRIGILSHGQAPTFRNLIKWLKAG